VLFLYAPPPPPPTAPQPATAAMRAAADYHAVFVEVGKLPTEAQGLHGPLLHPTATASSSSLTEYGVGSAGMRLASWQAFLRRWMAALRASWRVPSQALPLEASGPAHAVLAALKESLRGGSSTPATQENALWAGVALCNVIAAQQQQVAARHVVLAVRAMIDGVSRQQAEQAQQADHFASSVRATACVCAGELAGHVLRYEGFPAAQQLLQMLAEGARVRSQETSWAGVDTASVSGLTAAAGRLQAARDAGEGAASSAGAQLDELIAWAVAEVLATLCAAWPRRALHAVHAAAVAEGLGVGGTEARQGDEGVGAEQLCQLSSAVSNVLPALLAPHNMHSALVQQLHAALLAVLDERSEGSGMQRGEGQAACLLLPAVTALGFQHGVLSAGDVHAALRTLSSVLQAGRIRTADGGVVGVAAAGVAPLLLAVLAHGYAPTQASEDVYAPTQASEVGYAPTHASQDAAAGETVESPLALLALLLSVAEGAGRLAQGAAAKRGIAAGVAALLGGGGIDPASSAFKAAGQ
jgi:hypothetical protein